MASIWQILINPFTKSPHLRLRTLLIVPLVLQIMGVTAVVGYLSYRSGQNAVEDLAYQLMHQTTYRVHDRLDDYLGTAHQAIARNRQAFENGRVDSRNLAVLEDYFFRVLQLNDRFVTLGYGSATGESLLVAWDRDRVTATDSGYIVAETANPQSQENLAFRLDEQGQRLELIQTVQNYDPRQIIWYQTAVERGGPAWTPIYPLVLKPIASILAVTPVYQQDQLQGVLFATVPMQEVSDFLTALNFSPNGQVFIVERSGDLVATSTLEHPYLVNGPPDQRQLQRVNARTSEDTLTQAAAQALFDQFQTLDTVQQGQFSFTGAMPLADQRQHHQRHFAMVAPYQDDRGLDWLIVTVIPKSDFAAQIQANLRQTAALGGLALAGAIALSIWIARYIVRPILDLEQATQSFVVGRWHPQPRPTQIRELASLQRALRQMILELREAAFLRQNYAEELEQQVARQTIALQEGEVKLKEAQRIARVGSWEFDVTTGKLFWSEELFRIVGRDPDQFDPSYPEVFDLTHPDDRDKLHQAAEAAIAHGTPYEIEHRIIRPDGTTGYLVSRGEAMLDLHGQVVKLVGTASDVGDRKRADALIRESEARYRGVVEDQTELICRFLPDGTLTFVNPSYCRYFGHSEAELLGGNLLNLVPDTDRAEVAQLLQDLQSLTPEKPTVTQEHSALTLDGRVVWQQWTNRAIFDGEGQLVEFQAVGRDISDRRRAEALLRKSEARYRGIVEDQTELIARFQLDGTLLFVNDAFCRYYGVSREQAIGHSYLPRIYPDDQPAINRCLAALTPERPTAAVEHRVFVKEQVRWMQWVNRAFYDSEGHLVELQAVGRDIHDRKQAEIALEHANQQLEAFLSNAPAAICLFDADGRYYRVNMKFTDLFQVPASKIIGQTFDSLFPQETADLFRTRIQRLIATCEPLEIEDEVELNGDRRIFRSILFPVLNPLAPGEPPSRFWAIATDITERKQADLLLQESERKFATVFHANPTPGWIAALEDGRIMELNEGFSQFYGLPAADLVGKTCADLCLWHHPQDYSTFKEMLQAVGRVQNLEVVLQTRSQELRTVLMSASVNWINGGECVIGVLSDISDRKQAELQVRQTLAEKEILLQEVYHRVKNNLQLIQSMLRMQHRRLDNPEAAQILQESCSRVMAISLVHEILYRSGDLSQIDLANYVPAVVQQIVASFRSIGLPVNVNTQVQSVIVPMKKAICCGLILNELVTNALKYAFPDGREGEIEVILAAPAAAKRDTFHLVVRDNGVGLPANLNLSELDSLGLTLVQDLVHQLQGKLTVESQQGTRFTIAFQVKYDVTAGSP